MKKKIIKKPAKKVTKKSVLINFILDETGSMSICKDATISGFNEYINNLQKDKKIDYHMTLTKFNSTKVEIAYANRLIKNVPKLNNDTYFPNSLTPLYDAIAKTIKKVEDDTKKSDKILCVIMTDGEENASREYKRDDIFKMVKDKEKEGNWTFVYLGANQDSWAVGQSIGLHKGNVINFNQGKTKKTYESLTMATRAYSAGVGGQSMDFCDNMDKKDIQ